MTGKPMGALDAALDLAPNGAPKTPETKPATAEEVAAAVAHNKLQNIKEIWKQIHAGWVMLAEELHGFHQAKMWTELGYSGFKPCIAAETGIEVRWAYNLIEIWDHLVIRHGVSPERLAEIKNVTNVSEGLPALRRGFVDTEELLSDAHELSAADFRAHYRPSKTGATGAPAGQDPLDAGAEPEFYTCEACGSRVRKAAS